MGIEKLTIEQLREKHRDVFENPARDKVIGLRYRHEGKPNYKLAKVPVTISNNAYSEKAKRALPYFLRLLGRTFKNI